MRKFAILLALVVSLVLLNGCGETACCGDLKNGVDENVTTPKNSEAVPTVPQSPENGEEAPLTAEPREKEVIIPADKAGVIKFAICDKETQIGVRHFIRPAPKSEGKCVKITLYSPTPLDSVLGVRYSGTGGEFFATGSEELEVDAVFTSSIEVPADQVGQLAVLEKEELYKEDSSQKVSCDGITYLLYDNWEVVVEEGVSVDVGAFFINTNSDNLPWCGELGIVF